MMNEHPFISILVPAYNVEKYIDKCIKSVLNQEYTDYELIVINDGSTDLTEKVLSQYKNHPRIRVISTTNKGVSSARNLGIDLAHGKFIAQIDGDDYVSENWLKDCAKVLKNRNPDILFFGLDSVKNTGKKLTFGDHQIFQQSELKPENILYALSKNEIKNYAVDMFVKRQLIINMDKPIYPVGRSFEDLATTYKIVSAAQKVYAVNGIYYHYVRHTGSITNTKRVNYKQCEDLEETRKEIEIFFNNKNNLVSNWNFQILLAEYQILTKEKKKYSKQLKSIRKEILKTRPTFLSKNEKIKMILLKINIYSEIYPVITKIKFWLN